MSHVVLVGIACLYFCPRGYADLPATELLDRVYFGDAAAESDHQVVAEKAPLIKGGLELPARVVQLEGGLTVTLKCDPALPNLVTLRLWGGDVKQIVTSVDGEPLRMEAAQVRVTVEGQEIKEHSGEFLSAEPLYPGRFIYRTVAIPEKHTAGKQEVTITIKPAGATGGGYVKSGGPPPKETAPGSYSRGIYAVYSHTANVFVPPANEPQGQAPTDGAQTLAQSLEQGNQADFEAMRRNLVRALDEAVEELMSRQLYGPEYEAARDELGIPQKLDGLFDWTGLDAYLERGRREKWPAGDPQWLVPVTGSASGRPHTGAGQFYLAMYRQEGSRYHGDREMIDRTLALLDAYCRYQGADGGWEIGGGQWGWVGGPERSPATGGLPGYMAGGLAHSYLALAEELEESSDLYEQLIDNNGDGQATVTRKQAYIQVFRDWLWKDYPRLALRTACANQDMHTALAAYHVNQCLKILSPEDAFSDDIFASAFRQCMGIMPRDPGFEAFITGLTDNINRGRGDELMISPGGVTMEWGFAPGYGQMQQALSEMCQATQDPALDGQLRLFTSAIQHFILPWRDHERTDWAIESAIGSRNTEAAFRPVDWAGFVYAANELNDPVAQRIVRFGLEQTDNFAERTHGPQDRMHLTSEARKTLGVLERIGEFEKLWEQPPTGYRLPTEHPGPYAWTDPTSSARIIDPIMIKQGERDILYVQWNLYHLITDEYMAFGQTQLRETDHLVHGRIGPFLVAINRGQTGGDIVNHRGGPRVYQPPAGMTSALDLLTDRSIDLSGPLVLPERTALVMDTRVSPSVADSQRLAGQFVSATRDDATQSTAWLFEVAAPDAGVTPEQMVILSLPDSPELNQVMQSHIAGGKVFKAATADLSPLEILTVNAVDNLMAIRGLSAAAGQRLQVVVRGDQPSFATYDGWELKTEGGNPRANRAAFIELDNSDSLMWRLRDKPEDRTLANSTVQRTNEVMLYEIDLAEPVTRIAFDYRGKGANRLPIELVDGQGNRLWSSNANESPLQRVVLDDIDARGKLVFSVRVESDHVYHDFMHRVANVRLD